MADRLKHDQLARILSGLHDSKVLNLDVTHAMRNELVEELIIKL